MLSAKQILYWTKLYKDKLFKNAKGVSVKFVSVTEEIDEDGDKYKHIQAVCLGNTIPRNVEIQSYGKGESAKVWVTCDCEYWLYNCEVAVENKDSTDIIHSNGARPEVTNPRMVAHLCKHLIQCFLKGALDAKSSKAPKKTTKKEIKKKLGFDSTKKKAGKPIEKPGFKPKPNVNKKGGFNRQWH